MYCRHCGKEIADDSAFCSHCGKSLGQSKTQAKAKPAAAAYQAPVESKPKKPLYKRVGFWLLMIPVILFILLVLIGTFASSGEPEQAAVAEPVSREDFVLRQDLLIPTASWAFLPWKFSITRLSAITTEILQS